MIATLRTIAYMIVFFIGTIPAVLAALVAAYVGPRPTQALAVGWGRMHNIVARIFLGIRPVVEGRPVLHGPVMYAVKHESAYETMGMLPLIGGAPAVVLKRELTRIPFWGLATVRYGAIPVDREGSAKALRSMLVAAKAALAEGRSILIFPEGTRVAPGEMPDLRPGFAGLYRALGIPVVPVAVDSGHVWPRHRFAKQAGTVRFRFGEPIPAGLPRADIEARVKAAINVLNTGADGR